MVLAFRLIFPLPVQDTRDLEARGYPHLGRFRHDKNHSNVSLDSCPSWAKQLVFILCANPARHSPNSED